MNSQLPQRNRLWESLRACPTLTEGSPERDAVWLTVQAVVCTRHTAMATPLGSTTAIVITADEATDELISAMSWLYDNEARARALDADDLYKMLRGVATRGANGSARRRQSDQLHGLTHVSPGNPVRWTHLDAGVAS